MKFKTLFRVLLKAIGVLIAAGYFHMLLVYVAGMTREVISGSSVDWRSGPGLAGALLNVIPIVLQYAVALYLFFDGEWVVRKAFPSNPPHCSECNEDLAGASQGRCPRCGEPLDLENVRLAESPMQPGM